MTANGRKKTDEGVERVSVGGLTRAGRAKAKTMRILIVEDNEKVAALIVKRLKENLFVVDPVKSVDEAMAALEVVEYDLVVLDLTLPDGNGIEVLRALRKKGKSVPVLIETARDDVTHRIEALNQGADDYIVKPFSSEELLARVRAILRRPKQTAQSAMELGNVTLDFGALTLRINGEPQHVFGEIKAEQRRADGQSRYDEANGEPPRHRRRLPDIQHCGRSASR